MRLGGPTAHLCEVHTIFELQEAMAWATAAVMDVARAACAGRVVSVLEGGYNLDAVRDCAIAHVQTLKDH